MDRRRLGGVAILAVAVLVLSVGAAVGRPHVVGVAGAPPIDPPPQVGDCLYAGPDWPWGVAGPDGEYRENPYAYWFATCREPWDGEVVTMRSREDISAEASASDFGPGPDQPCEAETAGFLGRPLYRDPMGVWTSTGLASFVMTPNRRQSASGQMWQACVMTPPPWTREGALIPYGPYEPPLRTTSSLRGAWADATFRNQFGSCGDSRRGPEVYPLFCGAPHGTESLAWTTWPGPGAASGVPGVDRLRDACTGHAARMMQRSDPTGGGALTVDVWMHDFSAYVRITPTTELPDHGYAECAVEPTSPGQQLTATVVGLGEAPLPLTSS